MFIKMGKMIFFNAGVRPYPYFVSPDYSIQSNKRGQSTGVVVVKNATTITGVDAPNGLYIHSYVYSDDIEFSEPADLTLQSINMVVTESAYKQGEPLNMVATKDYRNVAISGPEYILNKVIPGNDNIFKAHFGEKIESLRVLLKRDQVCFSTTSAESAANTGIQHPIYPTIATNLTPTNLVTASGTINTFNLLRYCYLGVRGGMRYRFYSRQDGFVAPTIVKFVRTTNFTTSTPNHGFASKAALPNSGGGFVQNTIHGGVEYEVPYKESQLFDFPCSTISFGDFDMSPTRSGALVVSHSVSGEKVLMCSIAEDFNFLRFQGGNLYEVKRTSP